MQKEATCQQTIRGLPPFEVLLAAAKRRSDEQRVLELRAEAADMLREAAEIERRLNQGTCIAAAR